MAKLSSEQKAEIVRLRKGGMEYKAIARKLKCTPNQVMHQWRISEAKRQTSPVEIWQAKRKAAIEQKQVTLASEALRREIAEAVAEAKQAPLFKTGDLVW